MTDGTDAHLGHLVVGLGRWGRWLAVRLAARTPGPVYVHNRTAAVAEALAREADVRPLADISACPPGLTVWLTVSDDAIATTASRVLTVAAPTLLLHCSGSHALLETRTPTGVVWPIQSIARDAEPNWDRLPLALQAPPGDVHVAVELTKLAGLITPYPPLPVADDAARGLLHLAATLTQNFTNYLWAVAQRHLPAGGDQLAALLPLAEEHLARLAHYTPAELQTGPAARGDAATIERHRSILREDPHGLRVYDALTEAIRATLHP